jgi:hypothetical protein
MQRDLREVIALLQRRLEEHRQLIDAIRQREERRRQRLRRLTFGLFPR